VVVCGDGTCEYGETCSNCPKDCLKTGEICCEGTSYSGDCCVDADCGKGFECTLGKDCKALPADLNGNGSVTCEDEWVCTDWSECESGKQTRTCVYSGTCEEPENKPEETQDCEVPSILTGLFLLVATPFSILLIIIMTIIVLLIWKRKYVAGKLGLITKESTKVAMETDVGYLLKLVF
jgi:hypothetical protein